MKGRHKYWIVTHLCKQKEEIVTLVSHAAAGLPTDRFADRPIFYTEASKDV